MGASSSGEYVENVERPDTSRKNSGIQPFGFRSYKKTKGHTYESMLRTVQA
jgi:hypothetical protein